jgi:hypothetical protein
MDTEMYSELALSNTTGVPAVIVVPEILRTHAVP